jgi:hypothetical protein
MAQHEEIQTFKMTNGVIRPSVKKEIVDHLASSGEVRKISYHIWTTMKFISISGVLASGSQTVRNHLL